MRRLIFAALVVLGPVAANASEAQRQLEKWYDLNEACRGSIHPESAQTKRDCDARDALSNTLEALHCRPLSDADGWNCP